MLLADEGLDDEVTVRQASHHCRHEAVHRVEELYGGGVRVLPDYFDDVSWAEHVLLLLGEFGRGAHSSDILDRYRLILLALGWIQRVLRLVVGGLAEHGHVLVDERLDLLGSDVAGFDADLPRVSAVPHEPIVLIKAQEDRRRHVYAQMKALRQLGYMKERPRTTLTLELAVVHFPQLVLFKMVDGVLTSIGQLRCHYLGSQELYFYNI